MVQRWINQSPNPERLRQEIYSKSALRRIASPREEAHAALFLGGDESSFLTGSKGMLPPGSTVVFIHTVGTPALYANASELDMR
jgi:hypothetical protein